MDWGKVENRGVAVGEELQEESASFSELQHTQVGSTAYHEFSNGRRRGYGLRKGGGVEVEGHSGRCRVGDCSMGEEEEVGRDEVAVDVLNSTVVGKAGALGCCWPHAAFGSGGRRRRQHALAEPRPTCIARDELPSFVDIFITIALHSWKEWAKEDVRSKCRAPYGCVTDGNNHVLRGLCPKLMRSSIIAVP